MTKKEKINELLEELDLAIVERVFAMIEEDYDKIKRYDNKSEALKKQIKECVK